jgi:hypothetical protein
MELGWRQARDKGPPRPCFRVSACQEIALKRGVSPAKEYGLAPSRADVMGKAVDGESGDVVYIDCGTICCEGSGFNWVLEAERLSEPSP